MVGFQVIVKKMSHLPGDRNTWNIMSTKSLSLRLSFYYLALFLIVGTFVPYLPLWMGGRGLSSEQIGLVLAVALWAKIPVGLSMTGEIDYSGKRKRSLLLIALVSLGGMIIMDYANSFVAILLVWLLVGTLLTTAMPIADSLSLLAANRSGVRYGKVRRWGSISFIIASVAGGWYLQGRASAANHADARPAHRTPRSQSSSHSRCSEVAKFSVIRGHGGPFAVQPRRAVWLCLAPLDRRRFR